MENTSWSSLKDDEKIARIAKVVTKAGSDKNFLAACLDAKTAKDAIAKEAYVSFDSDMVVRCFPNQEAVENEILILLPEKPVTEPDAKTDYAQYWLCTYVPYRPQPN